MRFLIAGSSGFLGTRLREELTARGHDVLRLVRRPPGADDERRWDPYAAPLGLEVVDDVDVVVNLGGSPLIGNPHSKKWKREVERSRVATTRTLAEAIAASDRKPAFLAGNGISFYGDRGDELLDESSGTYGDHLLTRVTLAWQAATRPAQDAGARVVVLRTSPVLDRRSAPFKQLLLLFKAGLGGKVGGGGQYFPTIATEDWVGGVIHCAEHEELAGPVNLCIPEPATNADFTEALGRAVHRPTLVPVPGFAIKPLAGDMAPELLGSVRVVPQALLDGGYEFAHPDITATVAAAIAAGR